MPFLELRDVTKRFGSFDILRGLDLAVDEHQVVCLIGPSGCGKSTFLRSLNRMNELVIGASVSGEVSGMP